jgi:hypothetical protein
MTEATVTLRIIYDSTCSIEPHKWDWHQLLLLRHDESVQVVEES